MIKPVTYGRFGNFLFQAAAAIGYAHRHGIEYTLPDTTKDTFHNPIYLQHLVRKDFNPSLPNIRIKEERFTYQVLPFKEEWRNMNIFLDGYWQSEKYFKEFRDEVLRAFGFTWVHMPKTVSVHVRRGDYLTLTNKHPAVPKEWLEKAMSLFVGFRYIFFSDDREWCRKEFGHRDDVVIYEGVNEVDDLQAIHWCEHHICSASTFSWWGAWLNRNPDKRVILPSQWFMPGRREDTRDVVPESWERL